MKKGFSLEPDTGSRELLKKEPSLITIFPLLGMTERWLVQEFTVVHPSIGQVLFSYKSHGDCFIYEIKLTFARFEDQHFGQVKFMVDDVELPQPSRNDPSFPIGNGMENMFPFHIRLRPTQTFKILAGTWFFWTDKPSKKGIVHVRGAII